MKKISIELLKGEHWWGGASNFGTEMPFPAGAKHDLHNTNFGNQAAPILVSSQGRYVWSEEPFSFEFRNRSIVVNGSGEVVVKRPGEDLRAAFRGASREFFPQRGKMPDPLLFTAPQYNTWIELMYDQNEADILRYAKNLLREGYKPGVLMIDEGWADYYGKWDFHPVRFPRPKEFVRKLHNLGFKIMLWVVPFVVPDSGVFRSLRSTNVLVKDEQGKPVVREWWNGFSAVVDVTGGEGRKWFSDQLDRLAAEYAIDGFKFDAGDTGTYRSTDKLSKATTPNGHTEAFAKIGLKYPLNEFRACWKCGGEPLVQRLRDKHHAWDQSGLSSLIPNILAQGLLGHPFTCPDMVGGGEYTSFLNLGDKGSNKIDQELFVRSAQASALMPMIQFSAAPWRVLDKRHAGLCLAAAKLRDRFVRAILRLAKHAAKTGEPIVRHPAYEFPSQGYEAISDQFFLGPDILVAPVLKKGAATRKVAIPPGKWRADDRTLHRGPAIVAIDTPLERLPFFLKCSRTSPGARKPLAVGACN